MYSWKISLWLGIWTLWATEGSLVQKYEENTIVNVAVLVRERLGLTTNVVLSWTMLTLFYRKGEMQSSEEN